MACIPRKMNGYRVKQSSTVQRHLTGQQSLHYMCFSHVAEHKIISAVTIRLATPQAYFGCYGLQCLWKSLFIFLLKLYVLLLFLLLYMSPEEVFCKSPFLLHNNTSGLVFMFTAVFTLPVNELHQLLGRAHFNRIFSIIGWKFLNNDSKICLKIWPSIILTESSKEIIYPKRFPMEDVGIIADFNIVFNAAQYPGADSVVKS